MKRTLPHGIRSRAAMSWASQIALATVVMLGAVGCPTGTNTTGDAAIQVLPAAFNLGSTTVTDTFAVSNAGEGVLVWSIGPLPSWLSVSPLSGSTPVGGPTNVTMTVDRAGLSPGTYNGEFMIASNGGNRIVSVTIQVAAAPLPPTLQVTPANLDFGETDLSENLTVANAGTGTVDWQLTESIPWLSTSAIQGSTGGTPTNVIVTVDRTGLSPGIYSDNIEFTSNGGNVTVPVTMTVPGPTPLLSVSTTVLNFGTNLVQLTFTIRNTGTGTLNWNISESIPWLTAGPLSGSTTTETEIITVDVDRTGLSPNDYMGTLAITSDGGAANVVANMTVAPAQLVVTPTTLNFGKFATTKLFIVSNGGTGTVNWSVNTGTFPAWLSVVSPVPTNGSVSSNTESVILMVDRTGLSVGTHTFTFPVTSDAGNVDVTVNLNVAEVPVLDVDTGFLNSNGQPLAPLGDAATTFNFTIQNAGTGTLNWNIDPNTFPTWLSIAPVAGSNTGAQVSNLTITVNRASLSPGGYVAAIPITSNGGTRTLDVTIQVPLRPIIGVSPEQLDFGLTGNSAQFFVANIGDPGTVLNFLIVSDRLWLFNSPSTGTSIGTSSPIKDFQPINVSIDRSLLESTGATGTFTVYALDSLGNIRADVEPATVTVSVEATPLAFQTAIARARIPSMVRWSFIMRDIGDQSFLMAPELLVDAYRIFEDGVQIEEPSETTQVVLLQNSTLTEPLSDYRTDLRTKVVLLLDYSGSVRDAAASVGTDVQTLYETTGGLFIDNYFDYFANVERGFAEMAIMEFHDRNAPATVIQGFTSDRATLQAALQSINVTDHGASAILPAVESAAIQLRDDDSPLIPFDDADIRAIVMFSDGRLTTPPGEIQDTIDFLVPIKVRAFSVGWGVEVNHEPMARLAAGTGGHYYLSLLDGLGQPTVANFLDKVDECNIDLASHTVLSYVSLGEEENVPIRFDGALDNPNDNPDQGIIQGTLEEQNIDLSAVVGDIRMGQISMRTPGIVGGASQVTIRAEYMPRNINRLLFSVASTGPAPVVSKVPLAEGGIVEDWTLQNLGGGNYRLDAPTPVDVLPYGSFGDLVQLDFAGVGGPFTVSLFVDNSTYLADPEPKYFIYPDTIDVDADPFLAPAFPTPFVDPLFIDFGTGINNTTLTVRNIGGSYPYVGTDEVYLNWAVEDIPIFVRSVTPDAGILDTTTITDSPFVQVDRTIAPGVYNNVLNIRYTTGTLGVVGSVPVLMRIEIQPPVLSVTNTAVLAFGNVSQAGGPQSATFNIANTGQSTLNWQIPTVDLPAWVESVISSSGSTTSETDMVTVTVDPTVVGLGPVNTTINVLSNGGNELAIPISMTVVP
ncbi:MAG: hypothetical protein AMXMBFR82_43990 [Candidatus Hydrogenedentota bacterium]